MLDFYHNIQIRINEHHKKADGLCKYESNHFAFFKKRVGKLVMLDI